MFNTSTSREGQDESSVLKTSTLVASINTSLRVLRLEQFLKGSELVNMYELSESDMRLGWENESDGNSKTFPQPS